MKIALFGAGSAQFGFGMIGDMVRSSLLKGAEIALMDINGDALSVVHAAALRYVEEHNLPFTITATTDRKEALQGADFIIISIEVGNRFELWDQDWRIPQQYGIRQVYGENGGPGGLFHALRIIPPILEICGDAVGIAPDAHIFCYSNPMTSITTAVHRKYPGIKFYGMCHEIASLERYLPDILDTPFDNLALRAAGLNHFSVLVEGTYQDTGKDIYPDILSKAPEFFKNEPGSSTIWEYVQRTGEFPRTEGARKRIFKGKKSIREWEERGIFKVILDKFQLLPITVDSHLGEYISWAYDAADHQSILDFYNFYRLALAQIEPEITEEHHEKGVEIIEGILSDSGYEADAVNIPNAGFIPSLPEGIAVEVPAVVSKKGLSGITFPDYPMGFAALLRNYTGVYDLTAEAAVTGNREFVLQALLVNPLITEWRPLDEMISVMIDRQSRWLGYLR